MTLSNFLAAEKVGQATRWELPLLHSFEETLPQSPPPPTAEEIDDIEKAAYDEGYARGREEGMAQGYADGAGVVRDQASRLRGLVTHMTRPLQALDSEVERMLIALALDVGRRLAQHALQLDPGLVSGIVAEAVGALAAPARDVRVHLHPDDAQLVKDTLTLPGEITDWRVIADPELMRGDCRIVTDTTQVDARLDTREAGIAKALLGDPQ